MHALVHKEEGGYYLSPVFGYYRNVTATDSYKRYKEEIHRPFYVVWNEERTRLVKWLAYKPNTNYITPQITIIETDRSDWIFENNEDGEGCVDFLSKDIIEQIIYSDSEMELVLLEKCKEMDANYVFNEYPEIENKQDVENLEWATGGFHDAVIKECKELEDGSLYVYFEGTWGCEVEIWFNGDVEYSISSRDPECCDPYWYGSTVLIQDGFVYLIDDDAMTVDKITDGFCWFKARHMKYHIIPV